MTDFAVVAGLAFMFLCIGIALMHSLSVGRFTLLDWSLVALGAVYGGGWSLVAQVTSAGANPFWQRWLVPYEHLYLIHTATAFVLMGAVCGGWALVGSLTRRQNETTAHATSRLSTHDQPFFVAAWILIAAAVVMQWLYTRAYGGFIGLLDYSAAIRAGFALVSNPLSFLQPFGELSRFASFLFFGLWLGGSKRLAVKLGLALSVVVTLYILYSYLGRVGAVVYLGTFVLGIVLFHRSHVLSTAVRVGAITLVMLVGTYQLSIWFDVKAVASIPEFLGRELSFPFASFFAHLTHGGDQWRWFQDVIVAPVFLLPSSLWVNWVESASQVNTALLLGLPKGQGGITAGIPVDILTLGLMQASIPGVVVMGLGFGAIIRWAQVILDRIDHPAVRAIFEAYVALKIAVLGLFYAQPDLVVADNFSLLVAAAIITILCRLSRAKSVEHRKRFSRSLVFRQR